MTLYKLSHPPPMRMKTSQTNIITTQPSTSPTPNQSTTPSNTPPIIIANTTQPPVFQIPTIPPIPLSSNTTITTQSQSHNPQTFPTKSFTNNFSPSLFYTIANNLSTSQPPTSTLPPTAYNPYASLHPGFQNYPSISFQSPNLPPNPLPPSTSTFPFNPPPSPPPVLQITPSVP